MSVIYSRLGLLRLPLLKVAWQVDHCIGAIPSPVNPADGAHLIVHMHSCRTADLVEGHERHNLDAIKAAALGSRVAGQAFAWCL